MTSMLCPACQQQNPSTATSCIHCGFSFNSRSTFDRSTLGMETTPYSPANLAVDCSDFLTGLSPRAILFHLPEDQEQAVFENAAPLIIGRTHDGGEEAFFDMTRFGEKALGISRRHAQIIRQHGQLFIEDLGSTNGTWLNRQRLLANEPFPLSCGDVVSVGPVLKMVVCFHALTDDEVVQFILKPLPSARAAAASLAFLATHIMTFLQLVDTMQEIFNRYRQQPHQPIALVNLGVEEGEYVVALAGAGETVRWLQNDLAAWRRAHPQLWELEEATIFQPTFTQLAAHWLEQTASPTTDDIYPYIEELAAAITAIIAVPVQLAAAPPTTRD